jgi:hypothetical protein
MAWPVRPGVAMETAGVVSVWPVWEWFILWFWKGNNMIRLLSWTPFGGEL